MFDIKILPAELPEWRNIGLPKEFADLSNLNRGLVLCTGPLDRVNRHPLRHKLHPNSKHIITEDPIEYEFSHTNNSIIHQEELRESFSFASALKAL